MTRRLPIFVERAVGDWVATRAHVAVKFEEGFRKDHGVTCKEGCNNCCYYPVLITIIEGISLFRLLAGRGRLTAAMRTRLQEHGDLTLFMDPAVWMRANIPCPLLEGGKCSGYESRPLSCRVTFSSWDAEDCHPQAFNPSNMAAIHDISRVTVEYERRLMRAGGISRIRLPVGKAILMAERILTGELAPDEIEKATLTEYPR